jgi:hypothetical protein
MPSLRGGGNFGVGWLSGVCTEMLTSTFERLSVQSSLSDSKRRPSGLSSKAAHRRSAVTNHIFLIFEYFGKLKDLAMVLHWIELSTREHAGEPDVLALLDRKRTQVTLEKIRLQDEMFEIARSN